jgi:MFS family permease
MESALTMVGTAVVMLLTIASWIAAVALIMQLADRRGRAAVGWGLVAGAAAIAGSCVGLYVHHVFRHRWGFASEALSVAFVVVAPWLAGLAPAVELWRLPSRRVPPIPVAIRVASQARD